MRSFTLKEFARSYGVPRLICTGVFLAMAFFVGNKGLLPDYLSSVLVSFGMFGVLVLAMVPTIVCGIGPSFGLPLGILCGFAGLYCAASMHLNSLKLIAMAVLFSLPLAALVG